MIAALACGAAALLIALAFNLPRLDDTGRVGRLYADASAGPGVGFWLELVAGAGAGLLLSVGRAEARESWVGRR